MGDLFGINPGTAQKWAHYAQTSWPPTSQRERTQRVPSGYLRPEGVAVGGNCDVRAAPRDREFG